MSNPDDRLLRLFPEGGRDVYRLQDRSKLQGRAEYAVVPEPEPAPPVASEDLGSGVLICALDKRFQINEWLCARHRAMRKAEGFFGRTRKPPHVLVCDHCALEAKATQVVAAAGNRYPKST